MKTRVGEQANWNNDLLQAVAHGKVQENAKIGRSNTYQRDVTGFEKVLGSDSVQTGSRQKGGKLDQRQAQALAHHNQHARSRGNAT